MDKPRARARGWQGDHNLDPTVSQTGDPPVDTHTSSRVQNILGAIECPYDDETMCSEGPGDHCRHCPIRS